MGGNRQVAAPTGYYKNYALPLLFVCLSLTNNSEVTVESCNYKLINRSSETVRNLP